MKHFAIVGAAAAAFVLSVAGQASAGGCAGTCDEHYKDCSAANGESAQRMCMPKWMHCKKACKTTGMIAPGAMTPITVSFETVAATKTAGR